MQSLKAFAVGLFLCALTACTVTQADKVTTVTLNVAEVKTKVAAADTALNALVSQPQIAALLGANEARVQADLALVEADVAKVVAGLGSASTITLDATSAATLINTLLADAQTLVSDVQGVVSKAPGPIATVASGYLSDAQLGTSGLQLIASFSGL